MWVKRPSTANMSRGAAFALGVAVVFVVAFFLFLFIPPCPAAGLERDIYEEEQPPPPPSIGLHVIQQPPWRAARQAEFRDALLATLRHPSVHTVHALTESVAHQVALYEEVVPANLHHKLRTHNIGKRISYADGVRYANRYLGNTTTLLCNADISVAGPEWDRLSVHMLRRFLWGLSRDERPGCAWQCDCAGRWNGCHDCFAFVPPLRGGDALLERIAFRVGGLWGSENRFMWEVAQTNPHLRVRNPCRTFHTAHWHCTESGRYRPTQDQRRVNDANRSLAPWPEHWHL